MGAPPRQTCDTAAVDVPPSTSAVPVESLAVVQTILSDWDSFSSQMDAMLGGAQRARQAKAEAEGQVQALQAELDDTRRQQQSTVAEAAALRDALMEERRTRATLEARVQSLSAELSGVRRQQTEMLARCRDLARALTEVGEAHRALGAAEAARVAAQHQVQSAYLAVARSVEALPVTTPAKPAETLAPSSQESGAGRGATRSGSAGGAGAGGLVVAPGPVGAREPHQDEASVVGAAVPGDDRRGSFKMAGATAPRVDGPDADGATDEVQVTAGPFLNFASVHEFRKSIAVLPGIREIRFRGFHQSQLQLVVRYNSPVPLTDRLRFVGGFRPRVQVVSPTVVHLSLEPAAKAS